MSDFLEKHGLQLLVSTGVLVGLIMAALLILRKLRDQAAGNTQDTSDLLNNFQDLHQQGEFSEAEFRKIKSVLGNKLQRDAKDGKPKR